MTIKAKFSDLFREYPNGSVEPQVRLKFGGVEFGPGVRFGKGVLVAGINLSLFSSKVFEVEENSEGVKVIKGVYR